MTRANERWRFALWPVVLAALSCRVEIPNDAVFSCTTDADCDGVGRCLVGPGGSGRCCVATEEVCDGSDNDCNGTVDDVPIPPECYTGPEGTRGVGACRPGTGTCVAGRVEACSGQVLPKAEACNGVDDDCDGQTDEDFDFKTDSRHCGGCNKPCGENAACADGACVSTVEVQCEDGRDDEGDGKIDCDDSDCQGKSCGGGCTCEALKKAESGCDDGQDNDGDGQNDCADGDCEGRSCGAGCACRSGAKSERDCGDGQDNDGDGVRDCADSDCPGLAQDGGWACAADGGRLEVNCHDFVNNDNDGALDCADPDCLAQLCKPPPNTFRCTASGACLCNGTATPPPETACGDNADNNCNGFTDCADLNCNNQGCGSGCTCRNGQKAETTCNDQSDNDGDGSLNCLDSDCVGRPCAQGNSRMCLADGGCA